MTASPRIAAALGPLLAAPAAFAHDGAASGGSMEVLLLLLGAAVIVLGLLRSRSGARAYLLRNLCDGV